MINPFWIPTALLGFVVLALYFLKKSFDGEPLLPFSLDWLRWPSSKEEPPTLPQIKSVRKSEDEVSLPDLDKIPPMYHRWPEMREYINDDSPKWQQELIDDICERIKAHTLATGEFTSKPDADRPGEVVYMHRDVEGDLQFDYHPLEGNILGAEHLVVTNLKDRVVILDAISEPGYPWSTSVRAFAGGDWLVWVYEDADLKS